MMEAARTSETLVNLYQTTRCYNPEDSHLQVICIIATAYKRKSWSKIVFFLEMRKVSAVLMKILFTSNSVGDVFT
jgi:hypothetical protein